ncbi:DoxX family protein [Corynebacterium sp. HMSC056F09]|uniref:DoxX family protein n=1 Tax=unclassified Corynebacterium TaxID=2624378 RepID=UPI0008A62C1A|nr:MULTISPECIES: DoxX family membrane protein [unclassified Corynebacterium]OFK65123.1 DoxX family protein [Corynebacterium sp. HMSC074A09]OFK68508.1 DoxX family protein [Corynebacterium sp. HMSC076G08]OFO18885.1 DoxX family protein [Corynebacterium sp. HMSC056F09]OFQ53564.1 DoxX family protein [Corynebacterium sp. HMSC074H12]
MIRKFARPMLASVFVWDGVDTLRNTSEHVADTESVLKRLRKVLPREYAGYIPNDPELVTRALGGAKTAAGTSLALGKAPRTSAAVLALTHVPNLVGNAFWTADSQKDKEAQRNSFITNTALLGALAIVTQDTEGKPSVRWRAAKASERANKKIQQALPGKSEQQKFAEDFSSRANEISSDVTAKANDWFETAKDYVEDNRDDWESTGRDFIDSARSFVEDTAETAREFFEDNKDDWLDAARDNTETARKSLVKAAGKAQDRADEALAKADSLDGKRAQKKARKRAEKLQKEATKKLDKAFKKFGDRF